MADTIREFLVSFGFGVDQSSQAKAEAAIKANEERITKQNVAEVARRIEADRLANVAKVAAAAAAGKELTDGEKKLVTEQDERNRKAAERQEKLKADAADQERKQTDAQDKRRRERLEETTKQLRTFALRAAAVATGVFTAVEGAAGGILYAADRAAKGFERLNYVARDTGASVRGIGAFSYAVEQLGGNAQSAEASLAAFGTKLKTFPQFEQAIKGMGIATRDANGELRKTEDIAKDFFTHIAPMQRASREAFGRAYGFDESTTQAAVQPGFAGRYQENLHDQAATGNDSNANAAKGTAFAQAMRRLRSIGGGLEDNVTGTLFDKLQPQVEKFSAWLDANGERIAAIIGRIADDIIKLASAIIDRLATVNWDGVITDVEDFVKKFDSIASTAFGEKGMLALPFIAFGAMLTSTVLGPLRLILSALGLLGSVPLVAALATAGAGAAAAAAAQRTAKDMSDPNSVNDPSIGVDPETGLTFHVDKPNPSPKAEPDKGGKGGGLWNWIKKLYGFDGAPETEDRRVKDAILDTPKAVNELKEIVKQQQDRVSGESGGGVMGAATRVLRNAGAAAGAGFGGSSSRPAKGALAANQKEAYAAALKEGLSPTAARALVANMSGEGLAVPHDYHWDGTHMAQGIVQWDPTRSARIAAQFGKQPKDMTVAEQTKAAIWEMQTRPEYGATARALKGDNGPAMIDALVDNYERPRNRGRAKAQRYGYYRGFNPDAPATAATASAPSPVGTSAKAVTDAEVFAARQRLTAGGTSAADHALDERYRAEQNAPVVSPQAAQPAVKPALKKDSDHPVQERTLGRYIHVTRPLAAQGELPKPHDHDAVASKSSQKQYQAWQSPDGDSAPMTTVDRRDPRLAPTGSGPIKVEVTKAPLDPARQKLADAMTAEAERRHKANDMIVNLQKQGRLDLSHLYGRGHRHLGDTEALRRSVHSSVKGDTNLNHSQVFNIHGGDVKQNMEAARMIGDRGSADLLRNVVGMEA